MVTPVVLAKAVSENTTVILQADQHPIKAVKLFQSSGGAEVTRTFPLSLHCSQDEAQIIEIVHLPASIQSVDVSITSTSGNATILDHYHTSTQKYTPASQTLRELETERLQLEGEKRLRQQSLTFLMTYMDSLAQCKSHSQPEAAQMVTFFDEFVEIGITRSAAIAELDGKLADVANRISEETERLSKLSNNLPVKIVTVVSCNSHVPREAAELTVTYVVEQVSWKPMYDLHIVMTGNTPSPTVALYFRCAITQWTDESWENISLALTTADRVSQLIQLPELKRIDISLGPTSVFPPPSNAPRPFPIFGKPVGFGQFARAGWNEGMEREREHEVLSQQPPTETHVSQTHASSAASIPASVEVPGADVSSQTVSQPISHIQDNKDPITHIANGNISIPSDRAEHHVLVASLSLQAEFLRVVVPSIDDRVYITCKVKNTSQYVLLPGTVKAYLNNKHVSSIEIHNTELPQILECSLAVDTGVKAVHNRASDALPSVSAFSSNITTTHMSATVLHNTHAESIHGFVVRSSIPISADSRIKIVLVEPAGLAESDEGSVTVKEGCIARWSTTGGRKGKQAGLFEWVCNINPGTEVLEAVWEVCAPRDSKLLEQVRP